MNVRISKYDLNYRDEKGKYLRDDWTSVHDIGKEFSGKILSCEEYLVSERAYIAFVLCLFSGMQVSCLRLTSIEGDQRDWERARKHAKQYKLDSILTTKIPAVDTHISLQELSDVVRACMREFLWVKVEADDFCTLSFGYDFYVYVGGRSVKRTHEQIATRLGLFAERLRTLPY